MSQFMQKPVEKAVEWCIVDESVIYMIQVT